VKRKKPLPWRNAKRRPPAEASAQREAVMERSGGQCEFYRMHNGLRLDRCPNRAEETAHIIRRWKCGGAIYDPAVAVAACERCHDCYDHRAAGEVCVPAGQMQEASAAIRAAEAEREARGLAVVKMVVP
jgi:hypothetical protein